MACPLLWAAIIRSDLCSIVCTVQQLCIVQCTHIGTELTVVCWLDLAFLW